MGNRLSSDDPKKQSRYVQILVHIFEAHHTDGSKAFEFERTEIVSARQIGEDDLAEYRRDRD